MRDAVIHAIDLLLKKRDGGELSTAEIEFLLRPWCGAMGAWREMLRAKFRTRKLGRF